MSSNEILNVKWFHNGTYRRFRIPLSSSVDIYALLLQKVRAVVPGFIGNFAWKDEDGDEIVFSTDAEMREAIVLPINQQLFHISTVEKLGEKKETAEMNTNKPEEKKEAHEGVTCDGCDKGIRGIRYKCAVCDDFDLCESCERNGQHAEHPMIRYATPRTPVLEEYMRPHRHMHRRCRRGGFRGPLTAEGIFARCPAAATAAATAAEVAAAANEAAIAAAQRAANAFAENVARANTTNHSQDPSQPFRESFVNGIEYLREVGAQVQQALASFGIEVDMDVEHGGRSERVPRPNSDTQQQQPKTDGTAKENNENKETKEKRRSEEIDDANTEKANVEEDVSVPMKKMHISEQSGEQNKQSAQCEGDEDVADQNHSEPDTEVLVDIHGDEMDTWTMMDNSDVERNKPDNSEPTAPVYPSLADEGIKCMAGTPFIVPAPGPHNPHCLFIHPNKRVAECVKQLESMGFDNCNGWLTKLAATHGGDTTHVVESLSDDPVYAKRLQSCM